AASAERLNPDEIAHRILESRRSYLCLLDSAELLDENSAGRLRSYLGHVHTLVRESAQTNIRLGFVVASRRDNGWRGLTPNPRLSLLPLGTFERYAVQDALEVLAGETGRKFDAETFKDYAARAYGVTDGLPALLKRCLEWIQSQQWQGMERLE